MRSGSASSAGRLVQVLQPAIALLLLNRHARRVDLALDSIRSEELVSGPELDGGQSKRKTRLRYNHAGVQQNSAHCVIGKRVVWAVLMGECQSYVST